MDDWNTELDGFDLADRRDGKPTWESERAQLLSIMEDTGLDPDPDSLNPLPQRRPGLLSRILGVGRGEDR
ncbi:MAG: hypothetical protein M0Z41_13805 [Peptococcaceae bacterium]|jgi:hypothetical protein|nr:hypothetical protein [Peptococcaceae bacterium]